MTVKQILDRFADTEQPCDGCRFECESDQPCVHSEVVRHLGKFEYPRELINDGAFGKCPDCGAELNSELLHEYHIKHCPYCGQRITY